MPRRERQKKERRKSYSRIKGRKRRMSTSSEEEDEPWNTSLAVHETPSGEAEEFLCPYFDGSKLILPPGYENYKKKVEKDDRKSVGSQKGVYKGPEKTTASDGTPLRRSSRSTRTRKPMYIYSDDDSSSGFEDSKLSSAIASGAPVPTCMFVNAGVAGGSGIDMNKDVFKSLPQTKGLPTASQADDERIEFTIEINESTDEDDTEGTKPKRIVILPDGGETNNLTNVNGLNQTKSISVDPTEPDIKVKDDPIFLSDDEVISNDSFKNGKEIGEESKSSKGERSQEKALERNRVIHSDSDSGDEQKREVTNDDLQKSVSDESVDDKCESTAKHESRSTSSLSADATEKNQSPTSDSNTLIKENCNVSTLENEMPKRELATNNFGKESSAGDNETKVEGKDNPEISDRNEDLCSENPSKCTPTSDSVRDNADDGGVINVSPDQNNEYESSPGTKTTAAINDDDGHKLDDSVSSKEKDEELTANPDGGEAKDASVLESKDTLKTVESVNLPEAEEGKSEAADSEKTEEFEPEAEHPLITEIKEKMKEYCLQRVEFVETLEVSGNLAITADNEKPIRGSVGQAINKDNCTTVENPVPTVCVPQELSNLVQKLCKEKLQYNVELLIQGEIHATIDGTLVSTICNFSFEPEEDDF